MNIYEKLQSARVKLQSKKLKKSGKNKHTGFSYFELAEAQDYAGAVSYTHLTLPTIA